MRAKKTSYIGPLVLIGLGALFMIGAVVVFASFTADEPVIVTPTQATLRIPFPDVERVLLSDAKSAFDQGSAVFIDTRGEPYYSQGHIPGAISMTEEEVLERLGELSPSDWIIPYCT